MIPGMGAGLMPGMAGGGYVSLNDLLGEMGSVMPQMPGGKIGAAAPIGAVASAVGAPAGSVRGHSEAAASTVGKQGSHVQFGDIVINNPRPEMSSTSLTRAAQKAAWLAGRHLDL